MECKRTEMKRKERKRQTLVRMTRKRLRHWTLKHYEQYTCQRYRKYIWGERFMPLTICTLHTYAKPQAYTGTFGILTNYRGLFIFYLS